MSDTTNWFKNEWQNNKLLFFNEISCIISGVLSASYITFKMQNANFMFLYTVYIINTLNCLISALSKKSFGLAINSIVYLIIDIIGMIKLLM